MMKITLFAPRFSVSILFACALPSVPVMAGETSANKTPGGGIRIEIPYSAPADGFLSLALNNDRGQLVRSLLHARPVKAGNGTVPWEGTSDLGIPQPGGVYSTKAVFFTEKPKAEYVMTVGKNGNPPYRTPDGKGDWGGNLGGPAAICANSDSVMMVWSCVEDNQITGIQQTDADGNIRMRYYSFYPWDGRLSGTMDDRNFYLGILNAEKKRVEIAAYELGKPRGKILTALPTKPHANPPGTRWTGGFSATIDGMALTAGTIFATICTDDVLFIVDRATGKIRDQITLSSPRDVKVSKGGLIVQSGNRIIRLGLDGKLEKTLVDEGLLEDPRALAVDAGGGFFSSGAGGQVARFSADGKLIARIGKEKGAAKTGRFVSTALGRVAAMSLGPKDDSLWIQDTATGFPRTSRWTLEGQLKQEWFTPKADLWSQSVNPAKPNEMLTTSGAFADEPGIRAYEVDWETKTWRPGWFYDNTWEEMFACNDVFLGFQHGGNPLNAARGGNSPWPTFHYAGRTFVSHGDKSYFMNDSGNDDGAIYQYSAGHKPKPVALVSYHHVFKRDDGRYEGSYNQGPNQWMTWADRNGDGRMSTDEISLAKDVPALAGVEKLSGGHLDSNLNVCIQLGGGDNKDEYILPPKEILPNGVPVYDWSLLRKAVTLKSPDFRGGDGAKVVSSVEMTLPLSADDGFYVVAKPGSKEPMRLPGIDGSGWWASRNWRNKIVKFNKETGEPIWAVGRRAPGRAEPGQMYSPISISGKAGGAIFVADALGVIWVWSTDGLYLGRLFRDHHAGTSDVPADQELYGEIQSTFVFTHSGTGKIYHVGAGNETRIHELALPEIQTLASHSITLSPEQAKRIQPWDPDGISPAEKPVHIARPAPAPDTPGMYKVKVDGDLDGREGWPAPLLVLLDGQELATVNVMYDAENLYLGYRVSHPGGTANSGSELPYSPFVSGAYVDFTIAPDWSRPQRSEVLEGDLRVLLARVHNGEGAESDFHQGFWQKKAGGTGERNITSPAAQVHFDQISTVPGLKFAYKVDPEKDGRTGNLSYTVEVSVPLASLGLKEVAGKTVGFDVSVGTANTAGDARERAAHWAGLSEGRVVDRPGSTELLPHTWGTLTFAPARK